MPDPARPVPERPSVAERLPDYRQPRDVARDVAGAWADEARSLRTERDAALAEVEQARQENARLRHAIGFWAETARRTRTRHVSHGPCECHWCYLADALDGAAAQPPQGGTEG
jgi:hypothetical protein